MESLRCGGNLKKLHAGNVKRNRLVELEFRCLHAHAHGHSNPYPCVFETSKWSTSASTLLSKSGLVIRECSNLSSVSLCQSMVNQVPFR
ncbi:hypothetical protein CEXT_637951 [Caerostris extrusa]|uniref:Uncharacterized protein n=1 Tax=Caerostris extrusa TaxID=172846 RepID=A0AAV4TL11_CAEEX|nr:hypothetical protein CEXT_637951 [Caerostris extrusa]